jgi:hypothetical protein
MMIEGLASIMITSKCIPETLGSAPPWRLSQALNVRLRVLLRVITNRIKTADCAVNHVRAITVTAVHSIPVKRFRDAKLELESRNQD